MTRTSSSTSTSSTPYNLRHNIEYVANTKFGKIKCKLKTYDIEYIKPDGYYIIIILNEIIIKGVPYPDLYIYPGQFEKDFLFYDIQKIKHYAREARQNMENRALNMILKKIVNEKFEW